MGANIRVRGKSHRVGTQFIPETIELTSGGIIVTHDVVSIGDPVGGGGHISGDQSPDLFSVDSQIVFHDVFRLASIFDEVIVSENIIPNIFGNSYKSDSMKRDQSGEGLMYRVSFNETIWHIAIPMEMHRISS